MALIGMRQLRADLAATLRRASAGDDVTITIMGVPVARLVPVTEDRAPGGDPAATVETLVASGALTAPRRTSGEVHSEPVAMHPHPRLDLVMRDVR